MTIKITKHQAALLTKRQAALSAAQQALAHAQKVAVLQNEAALEVITQIAADDGHDSLSIERFEIHSKNDEHTLVLIEQMQKTSVQAG